MRDYQARAIQAITERTRHHRAALFSHRQHRYAAVLPRFFRATDRHATAQGVKRRPERLRRNHAWREFDVCIPHRLQFRRTKVTFKNATRNLSLRVVLAIPTFGRGHRAMGAKCRNRTTRGVYAPAFSQNFSTRALKASESGVCDAFISLASSSNSSFCRRDRFCGVSTLISR